MNKLLQLKGQFQKRRSPNRPGAPSLPINAIVTSKHINELKKQLQSILQYWEEDQTIQGALISVHYKCIVAKSNRLKFILKEGSKSPNDSIRGSKFVWEYDPKKQKDVQKHVFTHYISLKALKKSIDNLEKCKYIVEHKYNGAISQKDIDQISLGKYNSQELAKSTFTNLIVDANYVEKFQIDCANKKIKEQSIVTIYKTGINTIDLLGKMGIDMINAKMIDDTTLRLTPDEMDILLENAPYLISMSVKDFTKFTREDFTRIQQDNYSPNESTIKIPSPNNEPIIGVIDTHFDERVYFHEWVDYENKIDPNIELRQEDYVHGTSVSSIIVDGPSFNPALDDGCGRFRVKHFGVATAGGFSSFTILKMIRNIISTNTNIKVWNLSLGSAMEIDANFISPEAAELDRIQSEYDVIFIVAGTNKCKDEGEKKIGAPADSLNSLVVNSVSFDNKPASYTRVGPVLSFFYKPDISYYGGDGTKKIVVCEPLGKSTVSGTSFAAPWISRKIAYLIHIIGLSREIAKALIIDSAAGWNRKDFSSNSMGYGIVPIHIKDIINSKDDEIRFTLTGTIEEYETYNYNIPVPQHMDKYPFFAKATLVYFPKSNRNQGVDYTCTEMDIHFGRIVEKNGKVTISSINENRQSEDGLNIIYEEKARKMYRKWDNVKHISETVKKNGRPKKVYSSNWGLKIITKERLEPRAGRGLQFGVVITLKEMNGVNRIDDFIKLCLIRGWIVNEIDINNQIAIYHQAEEDIEFL